MVILGERRPTTAARPDRRVRYDALMILRNRAFGLVAGLVLLAACGRSEPRVLVLGFDGLDPEVQGTFLARLVVATGHAELPELEALVRGTRLPEEGRP